MMEKQNSNLRGSSEEIAELERLLREKSTQMAAIEDRYTKQMQLKNAEIEDLEATLKTSQHGKHSAFTEMERLVQVVVVALSCYAQPLYTMSLPSTVGASHHLSLACLDMGGKGR